MAKARLSPQERAAAQKDAVRDALYVLGSADVKQVAKFTGLPLDVVARRLRVNGPQVYLPIWRLFALDAETGLWSLTGVGRREAEAAKAKPKRA